MKPYCIFLLFAALIAILACNAPLQLLSPATKTPTATDTAVPTPTEIPLYTLLTLETIDQEETSAAPIYTLKTHTPVLHGSDDARVQQFNTDMVAIVQSDFDGFKKSMAEMPDEPFAAGSFFELNYDLLSPPGNILSLLLTRNVYMDGAAHPYQAISSYSFDLEKGQEITLDQLFVPGSDYLKFIADQCVTELRKRDIGFDSMWEDGAKPTAENYAVWNITPEGLLITFNEYQVAAYAAGPQKVLIPYNVLSPIISADGPLAIYRP